MSKRVVLEIPGVDHGSTPIPLAVRVGDLVTSSAVMGADRVTGLVPDDPRRQVELLFDNLDTLMQEAGGTLDDVAKLTVYISDDSVRPLLNEEWVARFPDGSDRPARHVTVKSLPLNFVIQVELIGQIGA